VERVLAYIARAEKCQARADAAAADFHGACFLHLAKIWLGLAETRRRMLSIEGKPKPS